MQQRIVSLAPSVTSILCALGAHKQLVGVTRWCRDVVSVRSLPTLGDCWRTDAAKVAALKPDLVIGSVPYQAETVKSLLDRNLTFLAMNPLSLNDIFADIRLLGRLVDRQQRAGKLVLQLRRKMQQFARRTRRIARRPRVYCEEWPKPLMVSPPWVKEMIELAGGRFVPNGRGGRIVKEKEILQAQPEIIVLGWAACGMRVDGRKVLRRPGWHALPAVRDRRVYIVSDEALNTPGPPVADGLERLGRILHPEVFGPPEDAKVARVA